jgi:Na+/pantothenate symporter
VANAFIGVIAVIAALYFETVLDLVMFMVGFWSPIALIPLIFALYQIKVSVRTLCFASFCGCTSSVIWDIICRSYLESGIKGVFVGTCISLIIFMSSPRIKIE